MAVSAAPLRVLSFNIRYSTPKDGENAWPLRKALAASVIRFHNLDLVGLQEALKEQVDDLAALLPEFGGIGVGREDGRDAGEFSLILYRKSRLEPLQQATFWLSESPDHPSKGWDADHRRIVTWAKFRERQGGQIFFHFNTHFDNKGDQARQESARLLRAKIEEIAGPAPVLVTGDFNCTEDSPAYRLLTEETLPGYPDLAPPLLDAHHHATHPHHGPTQSTNDNFASVFGPKIDYVFVRNGVTVQQHGILPDHWDGRYPSDHLPVLAELEVG